MSASVQSHAEGTTIKYKYAEILRQLKGEPKSKFIYVFLLGKYSKQARTWLKTLITGVNQKLIGLCGWHVGSLDGAQGFGDVLNMVSAVQAGSGRQP